MLKRLFENEEFKKLVKFGVVGVLNTAVDYAVFTLAGLLSPNIYLAQSAGYCCGVLNSYCWNRRWTFRSEGRFLSAELVKFIIVNLATYLASLGALWLLADYLGINKYLAKLLLIGVTLVINFALSRLWVFGKGGGSHGEGRNKDNSPE